MYEAGEPDARYPKLLFAALRGMELNLEFVAAVYLFSFSGIK